MTHTGSSASSRLCALTAVAVAVLVVAFVLTRRTRTPELDPPF